MTDPFAALRLPDDPVAPDPAFAARLRARLERALTLPPGVAVSDVPTVETPESAEAPELGAAIPYLAVPDARAAIEWYVDVLGATVSYDPIVMPDGRIGHCELRIGGGLVYLADAHPEIGVVAPTPGQATVSLMLPVADADETLARALAAGATSDREVYDGHGHRNAWVEDPFGHRWGLNSPLRPTGAAAAGAAATDDGGDDGGKEPVQGDLVYVSLQVPDAGRAAAFYRSVVGWEPAGEGDRYQVSNDPQTGITGGAERPSFFCCYIVDDLDGARDRVREAGGRAGETQDRPWGQVVDCVDDAGTEFALFARDPEVRVRPARAGGLTYLTIRVPDTARFRTFYAAVLGWSFTPGQMDDGWEVVGSTPMIGVGGGADDIAAIPMWEVTDLDAAVAAARAAGGTASDPDTRPYGRLSEGADDQGLPFYLGQTR